MSFSLQRTLLIPCALLMFVLPLVAQYNEQCNDKGKSVPTNPDAAKQAEADRKCERAGSKHRYGQSQRFDIASGTYTGGTLRGPALIKAVNLNTIRYDYEFGSNITIAAAPNVWTGLTALATTNAGSTPKAPADTAQTDTSNGALASIAQAASIKQAASPKQQKLRSPDVRRAPAPPPSDPFDPVTQAMAATTPIVEKFSSIDKAYKAKMAHYSGIIDSFNLDAVKLHNDQITANQALGLVTQSGSALTTYLNATLKTSVDLIQATQTQLSVGSVFMAGTTAVWPASDEIASLQSALAADANTMTTASAELTGYAPTALASLKTSEASMTVQLSQLQAAEKTYESTANPPDENKTTSEKSVEDLLTANIALVQADEAFLNALPAQFTAAIAQNATAVTAAAALAPGSSAYTNFTSAREALRGWKDKMTSTNQKYLDFTAGKSTVDPFALSRPADCSFAFSSTKDTVVTLTRVDLTPGLVNPTAQTVLSVTVECTSPFTLSAGVAFSTIADPEYTLTVTTPATSTTPAVDSISLVSTSHFHPLPLALASMRVWEPNEHVALYASFGVAANIRDQSSGGSTAEYLLGPTIGFFRTFLITPGVHFGSEPRIADPYTLNGTVPSSVSSVPITTNYRPAFGLGITFTVPK